ncbi:MAG: DUF6456 domain-containing protein [Paracoccaceae bacterium]
MPATSDLQDCRRLVEANLPVGEAAAPRSEAVALYLAHTALGVSLRRLATATGRAPSTVLRAVRRVEARRDDPLWDDILAEIETVARPNGASAPHSPDGAPAPHSLEVASNMPRSVVAKFDRGRRAAVSLAQTPDGRPTVEAVEKEARRILRRLGEPRAFIALARGAEVAVVFRAAEGGGGFVTLARTPVVMAREFARREWILSAHVGPSTARYELSAVGRAWLKRVLAEDGTARRRAAEGAPSPFARQHQEAGERLFATETGVESRPVNLGETPLGWLARRRGPDGAAFLKPEEVAAGERLREDFEAAQMGPRVAQDWRRFLTAGVEGGPGRGPAEGPEAARRRLAGALEALGPGLEDAAVRACCFLEGLEATERRMGWSARSGKVVLKIALGRLAEHYGFARASAEEADAGKIRSSAA